MILKLIGIYSHTDKFGKLWFNFVDQASKEKLERNAPANLYDKVPYTTNYFIISKGRNPPLITNETYGASELVVTVSLTKYSFKGITGMKLTLQDIEKKLN